MAEIPKYTIIMTVIFINAQELHIFEHSKKKSAQNWNSYAIRISVFSISELVKIAQFERFKILQISGNVHNIADADISHCSCYCAVTFSLEAAIGTTLEKSQSWRIFDNSFNIDIAAEAQDAYFC